MNGSHHISKHVPKQISYLILKHERRKFFKLHYSQHIFEVIYVKKKNDVLVSSRNDPWQFCKIF